MNNSFTLEKSQGSYYIQVDHVETKHCRSTTAIESDDPARLVSAMLAEFDHSTQAEKDQYQAMLMAWLTEVDDSLLFSAEQTLLVLEPEQVKHNTYEMF